MTVGEWTSARLALLRAEYPGSTDTAALRARINALPGAPISSVASLRVKARKIGLSKTGEALAAIQEAQAAAGREGGRPLGTMDKAPRKQRQAVTRPVEREPAVVSADPATAAIQRKHDMARRMLMAKRDAAIIAARCALPLREVFRLAGEIRQERAAG